MRKKTVFMNLIFFIFVLLSSSYVLLSLSSVSALSGVSVESDRVIINTTYKEPVFLVPGFPKLFDIDRNLTIADLDTEPGGSFVSASEVFVSRVTLRKGEYLYLINVTDFVSNQRGDSVSFTVNPPPEPGCGNGVVDPGEECDGVIPYLTCEGIGFSNGTLSCSSDCKFSGCVANYTGGSCGDGRIDGIDEYCDRSAFGNLKNCSDIPGFSGGFLSCGGDCHFDTSYCSTGGDTVDATCVNQVLDETETDLDCGGICPGCAEGKSCLANTDCAIGLFCDPTTATCKAGACDDTLLNGFETDVDCGGGSCNACELDKGCTQDSDCASKFCDQATLKCATPSCTDSIRNGEEADLDCGSVCPEKCILGQSCSSPNDCQSAMCEGGVCSVDKNLDTDGDGIPDWWELKYGLDPENPDDAAGDLDKDHSSNLDEYLNGTDPTDPLDPPRTGPNTFGLILVILGVLFMGASAGFLVYSRKVLVPAKKPAVQNRAPQLQSQQVQRRGLQQSRQRLVLPTQHTPQQPAGALRKPEPKIGDGEEYIDISRLKSVEKKQEPKPQSAAFSKLDDLSGVSKRSTSDALKELSERIREKKKGQEKK